MDSVGVSVHHEIRGVAGVGTWALVVSLVSISTTDSGGEARAQSQAAVGCTPIQRPGHPPPPGHTTPWTGWGRVAELLAKQGMGAEAGKESTEL